MTVLQYDIFLKVIPNILSPNEIKFENFSDFHDVDERKKVEISGPDKPDDPPLLVEMRRRIIDIVHELEDIGEFDRHANVKK